MDDSRNTSKQENSAETKLGMTYEQRRNKTWNDV